MSRRNDNLDAHGDGDGSLKEELSRQRGVPTIAKFRQEKEARRAAARENVNATGGAAQTQPSEPANTGISGTTSGTTSQRGQKGGEKQDQVPKTGHQSSGERTHDDISEDDDEGDDLQDTSEAILATDDPKKQRHHFSKKKDERAERQVTDPVTHLPVTVQDLTSDALKDIPENEVPYGSTVRSATGRSNKDKSNEVLRDEGRDLQQAHDSTKALFPPPDYEIIKKEIQDINTLAITVGLIGLAVIAIIGIGLTATSAPDWVARRLSGNDAIQRYSSLSIGIALVATSVGAAVMLILGIRDWMRKRLDRVWEEEIWEASRGSQLRPARSHETETTAWLNSLLSSVWPLVNPDLFLSLADTLEDVMQASLPKMVQMVSVNDIGQGSEAIRILGIRWLPSGAAARSVNEDGSFKSSEQKSNRQDDGSDQKGNDANDGESTEQQNDGSQQQVASGMEAEEGDFVNMEIAFAYRARAGRRSLRDRAKDMHLYIAFYLSGNLKIPVWVDLRGVVGTMRLRLQLCPDPPFFSLCTLTFLGQPKVDISCTPLNKHAMNIMDVPLISNFVQSAVDAAMAQYVAPKSLSLDLKDLLEGDDFKKDTHARGIIVVTIKRGYDFKEGDPGIPLIRKSSSDPYVSVGWAKFGKPVWSTRIMLDEMEPIWNETAYLLVTPEELNVNERLRLQLWDSDRLTADDDLGRIEVDLKEIMQADESKGRMSDRADGFRALKASDGMPGKLEWSVGYYAKTGIQDTQLEQQTFDPEVRTWAQLRDKVDKTCERKLREAEIKKGQHSRDKDELEQLKKQEMKSWEDAMIISAVPPDGYPSGIFSIQIHQITGLELERLNNDYEGSEQEEGESLPSAYCTVVINHSTVFRTRTKPKNARPFYNAGTERFIADWRAAEVFVSVRDARVSEDDPLLGIVHLPLADIFRERSQVNGFFPITGGVGFGRMRLSMVWRSVELKAPLEAIGWSYGTVEIQTPVSIDGVPDELQSLQMKFHTDIGKGRLHSAKDNNGWNTRKQHSLRLPVCSRYSSCMTLQFRQHRTLGDKTYGFAVLWLRNIPDDETREITLTIWKGDFERARKCSLEDCGEKVGSITLKLTFYGGLGDAHSRWASKDPELRDVVEILDTARDNLEQMANEKEVGIVDGDVTTSDEEDDSSDDDNDKNNDDHEKSGPIDAIKGRIKHEKSLSRRNRGLMQWRAPRKAQWAINKLERTGAKIPELIRHHSRQQGIETEA